MLQHTPLSYAPPFPTWSKVCKDTLRKSKKLAFIKKSHLQKKRIKEPLHEPSSLVLQNLSFPPIFLKLDAHHTATRPGTVGHRKVKAEDFSAEGGYDELGGAVHQLDDGLGVHAALGGQAECVRVR